ncbi:MAG: putative hydrolase of the HAD superfamily [Flavobacteriales bacterium]|jgi:putative hydrolase of the HAD superfamily
MIGDSIEADLLGAKGVQMDQVYFNPEEHQHEHSFTHEIKELDELLNIL